MTSKFRVQFGRAAAFIVAGALSAFSLASQGDTPPPAPAKTVAKAAPKHAAAAKESAPDACGEMSVGDCEYLIGRIIRLEGDIDGKKAGEIDAQLHYLDDHNPDHKDITLIINSGGGDMDAGFAIIDTMNNLKADVATRCEGQAASMAADILAAGKNMASGPRPRIARS